jgi:WD40 repeat protein/energy-coupling factor transporter ATP-binding protein EcfA2
MQHHPSNQPPIGPSAIQTRDEFTAALRLLHERSGLTFREVSRDIEISAQAVHGYTRGKHLPSRWKQGALFVELLRTGYGITDQETLDAWVVALKRVAAQPGPRRADEQIPYPGLRPFREGERDWFFGRSDLVARMLDTVKSGVAEGQRSMLIIGPSGAGKSSLVNVGILAAADEHEALLDWRVERMTPGTGPLAALRELLTATANEPCLLVVDQMEELWAESVDPSERREFLEHLEESTKLRTPPLFAILVIRADFYEQVLNDRFLVDIDEHRQVKVIPMNEAQLKAAIEQPARAVNVEVEPALTELLLRDLTEADVHTVGALPLLALTLRELWGRGPKNRMTRDDYSGSGGLADIVQRTAETTLDALPDDKRGAARTLLTHMVSVHEDLPLTRRRLSNDDLDAFRESHPALDEVLERFTESRLLVRDEDGVTLAHDAILRAWPRLHEWIEADRSRLAAHSELDQSVQRWEDGGRPHAYLYQPGRLRSIEERLGPDPMLSTTQGAFLEGSRHRAARLQRIRQGLVAAMAVLVIALAASLVIALDQHSQAVGERVAAEDERRQAESRQIATRAEQLRQSDPALAAQLAVAAYQTAPTLEARSALLSATSIPTATRWTATDEGIIERIAINREGTLIAAVGDTGDVWCWEVTDPFAPRELWSRLPGVEATMRTVQFAGDDRLYSAGEDDVVYLHDIADPAEPKLLATATGPQGGINYLALHPVTGAVVAGGLDTYVWLWEDPGLTGEPVRLDGPGASVKHLSFSPDGTKLAAAGFNGMLALYEFDANPVTNEPALLDSGTGRLISSAFNLDGTLLAAGDASGTVHLWDTSGPPEVHSRLDGPHNWVFSVVFLPESDFLVAGTGNGVWLWNHATDGDPYQIPSNGPVTDLVFDARDGATVAAYADGTMKRWGLPGPVLHSPSGIVWDVQYFADGSRFAAATSGSGMWLWEVGDSSYALDRALTAPEETSWLVGSMSASSDGMMLAASGFDGRVWLWNLDDPHDIPGETLLGMEEYAENLAFSPDGTRLAAAGTEGTVVVWDVRTGAPLITERVPSELGVVAIRYSPDGSILAAGGLDQVVWLWDGHRTDRLVEVAPELQGPVQEIAHIAFSPDGSMLAAGSSDGNAYLWRLDAPESARNPSVLDGNGSRIANVGFSPDDSLVAASSFDGGLLLWNVDDPTSPRRYATLTGSTGGMRAVAFSPDGSLIAGAGNDPAVRLWLTDPEAAAAAICEAAGTGITEEEWRRHVPGVGYRPPC